MKTRKCLRCRYEWLTRIFGLPRQCPRCKSPKWNTAKKERLDANRNRG